MRRTILFFLTLLLCITLSAQNGTLRGKVSDAETGEELIGATVLVEGTLIGSSADLDGNYSITGIKPGKQIIKCQYISYETQLITDVEIISNQVVILDIKLNPVSLGLDEIVVSAKAVRNTESALLTMQKKSASVIDGISSQQFAKSGDSDAAGAIKRVTGVSIEGGKYVYVRGLGDRYSKTTLNGAEIPSLDPERNTVQMDIFPTNAIENMVVYKSFSPNLNPFTGGLINIVTKDFPEKFNLAFSAAFEYNTQSSFNNEFLGYEGGKWDGLGFDEGNRNWPVNPEAIPLYPANRDQIDATTRSFNKTMEPTTQGSFMNQHYSFSAGNQIKLFGKPLGYNFGLSYKQDLNYYTNGERGIYKLTDANAEGLNIENEYDENKGEMESLIGGLLNLNYKISANHKIGYVLFYNQSGIKEASYDFGQKPSDEFGMYIQSRELGFKERMILANQLKGEHFLETLAKLKITWIVSLTRSMQNEPDLRFFTNSYYPENIGGSKYEINPSKYKVPSRFNRSMNENNLDAKLNFELPFKVIGAVSKFSFGGAYVYKFREFTEKKIDYLAQVQYYNGSVSDYLSDGNIGQANPLYDPITKQNYGLYVQNATDLRNSYDGTQSVFGIYAMADMPVFEKFRIEAGARFENSDLISESKKKNIPMGELNDGDLLPAMNLTYAMTDNINLRLAYTRTLSRPTFREIAPFASFSPVAPTIVGNPGLKSTLIDNFDIKWEYFMKPGEIISFGLFYKIFTNPIEMVDNPVASNPEISYQNVDKANNYGFETELRKSLDFVNVLRNLSVGVNFSYIRSEVSIDSVELRSIRALVPGHPDTRPLFGQAPYIFNALLAYQSDTLRLSANLVFNITGERISLVTKGGTPDVLEQPFPSLDFNLKKEIGRNFTLSFSVKNLLNSVHNESYTFNGTEYSFYKYSKGMSFGFGLTYNLH